MKEMPSVTSTCASCWPGSWRSSSRSSTAPNAATSTAASSAATQKLNIMPSMPPTKVAPKYAPSMNSEPCVKFGIRISPKISEKPADNRNSKLPKVMLLTVSSSQKFISAVFRYAPRRDRPQAPAGGARGIVASDQHFFSGG